MQMMPADSGPFRVLARRFDLDDRQIAYARLAGVRTEGDFYSFLVSNPELGIRGLYDTPDLTERLVGAGAVNLLLERAERAPAADRVAFGAVAPADAAFGEGAEVPDLTDEEISELASFEPGPLASEEPAGFDRCGPWPVRDQGARGTCVSFAICATYELFLCSERNVEADLSEQFLYWAIKHHGLDGRPNNDGTRHEFAALALTHHGVCSESVWRYDDRVLSTISHDPPPAGAASAARALVTSAAVTKDHAPKTSGKARVLLDLLRRHNGVSIALPVFSAPGGALHNWGTPTARAYGEVQGPLPGWYVDGGHAVCCLGFVPDPDEPLGGHFVFRNSWGTSWGNGLPRPDYFGLEPGYGQVSASYVDRYLWETCVF